MAEQEHLELMERYLRELAGRSVIEQLKLRNVVTVAMAEVSYCGPYLRTGEPVFKIWLKQDDSPEEQKVSLGHEICHIFDFDLKSFFHPFEERKPRLLGEDFYAKKDDDCGVWNEIRKEEEDFCEEFARRWLQQDNNEKEAEALIKKVFAAEKGILYIE